MAKQKRIKKAKLIHGDPYREIVENANSIILRVDKNLKITFINDFAQKFFGYTTGEIIGKSVVGTIISSTNNSDDNLAVMAADIIQNPENYINNTHGNLRKNGELVWVSWSNKALYDQQGNLTEILSIGNDITHLKQLEENAQVNETRFKNIFESSPIGIELYSSDGRLIHVNQACMNIFGIINMTEIRNFNLFNDPNLPLDAKDKLSRGEVAEYECDFDFNKVKELGLYHTSKSGIIHLQVIISPLFSEKTKLLQNYLVQVQDITKRKLMETELKESEKKYRELVKYAPAGIYEVDFRNKRFLSVNDAMCQFSGYTREELLGMNPFDILDDQGKKDFQERIGRWLNGEKPEEVVEYKVKAKDGRDIYAVLNVTFTTDEDGKPIGATVIGYDITERKKIEEALHDSEELFKTFMNHNPSLIFLKDEWGRYVYLNNAYEKQFVHSQDWYGKTDFDFWPKESAELFRENDFEVLKSGKMQQFLEDSTDLQGKRYCWLCYKFPFTDSRNRRYLGGIGIDATERIRAEEALRDAMRLAETRTQELKAIIDTIPDGLTIYNKDGNATYINDVSQKILASYRIEVSRPPAGRTEKAQVCKPDGAPLTIEDTPLYHALKNGETTKDFVVMSCGGEIYTTMSCAPVRNSEGEITGAVVTHKDITERKQLENELQKINERLEEKVRLRTAEVVSERQRLYSVMETLPVMICLLTPDYHVSFANRSFRQKFGESLGRRCYEYCYSKTEPCEFCESYRVLETGRPHQWKVTNLNGRVIEAYDFPFTDVDGSPMILEMGIDITEQIKFENALINERQLLMVTLNSLTEGVIATDSEERIFLINESAVNLTGYSQIEAIDEPLPKILYVADDKTREPISQITTQKPQGSMILVTRNLRKIPISIHSSPIKTGEDQTIGRVLIFQDATEKQKTDQEILKTEKLESLGVLAGGIAHDFNNLLAAILSNIQLAQLKYKKNQDIGKYLQESVNSTHRASDLTRQLLTFSKGGAPVKKAATLTELIRETATFALRGSSVKVVCNISKDLWPVEVDTGQISQVIHNLAINAKHAMPKGGMIEINAENITIESNHRIDPGKYIKIAVIDQGIGIPKEHLSKIFDPFFTTKSEGSGLGLTTSYSIIRQHDGCLEVESEVGVGTTFFIYLPALSPALVVSDAGDEAAVTAEGLKILLMDDEETILKSVGEMLEIYGHQVVMVTDGSKAIENYLKALENGVPFDVVIMDLTVPGGMGGQEAIAHLRDIDPKVKAIVSSGYANDPIMADYERFGFSGVVTKPYKFDELNKVLNRVVEQKQLSLKLGF